MSGLRRLPLRMQGSTPCALTYALNCRHPGAAHVRQDVRGNRACPVAERGRDDGKVSAYGVNPTYTSGRLRSAGVESDNHDAVAVSSEGWIVRDESQGLDQRLRHDHPIERVCV